MIIFETAAIGKPPDTGGKSGIALEKVLEIGSQQNKEFGVAPSDGGRPARSIIQQTHLAEEIPRAEKRRFPDERIPAAESDDNLSFMDNVKRVRRIAVFEDCFSTPISVQLNMGKNAVQFHPFECGKEIELAGRMRQAPVRDGIHVQTFHPISPDRLRYACVQTSSRSRYIQG